MTDKQRRLIDILQEMFQLDQSDLDFGIYRIMNAKADEIRAFLEKDLVGSIKDAFSASGSNPLQAELDEAIASARSLGVDPETIPKVQELRAKLSGTSDATALENDVYSHLATFFSRYYKDGDFVSLRRYKKDTYAIPYEGEEVKLHWANSDQYYIKTSEYFKDYTFKVADKTVHFKLIDADTESNNNKASTDKERRFVIYEEKPAEEIDGELYIYFEYKAVGKEKQEKLNEKALDVVMGVEGYDEFKSLLATPAPTEKNKKRTLLEKHLKSYTSRNSFDYFIHKDLGGFLNRELDFYIKNEMLYLDDIEGASTLKIEESLSKIKTFKSIAKKIIAFLTQLEEFQKSLWLKKKFVIETNYCITLDKIDEKYYEEIFANKEQLAEWRKLYGDEALASFSGTKVPPPEEIKYLVLDTKFFDTDFKNRLLAEFDDLDEEIDGVLINSENFGALNLLQERYKEQVKTVYIDPPYNTGNDGFLYHDSYQHSSWLSFINDRVTKANNLISDNGVSFISIDENEYTRLRLMLSCQFGSENILTPFIWKRKAGGGDDSTHIASENEYALGIAKSSTNLLLNRIEHESASMTAKYNKEENGRRYYLERLDKTSLTYSKSMDYPIDAPDGEQIWPPQPSQNKRTTIWRWGKDTIKRKKDELEFKKDRNGIWRIYTRTWEPDERGVTPRNLVTDAKLFGRNRDGTQELSNILEPKIFSNPKPTKYINYILKVGTNKTDIVTDYFAGSGTTGHAVINLNREDNGKRKYILVEMGEYFDTVTKPRIQKVIYSEDWLNGKPKLIETIRIKKDELTKNKKDLSEEKDNKKIKEKILKLEKELKELTEKLESTNPNNGISQMFKYFKLESYEDTLNNLEFKRTKAQQTTIESNPKLKEDYLLNYMLDYESSASQLSIDNFSKPFDYKLKVSTGSAGETKETAVDLIETFNYLIGLKVKTRAFIKEFLVIEGENLKEEKILIIWREGNNNEALNSYFSKMDFSVKTKEFDTIYVNGDNNLASLKKEDEHFKVKLIEEEFKNRMFGA